MHLSHLLKSFSNKIRKNTAKLNFRLQIDELLTCNFIFEKCVLHLIIEFYYFKPNVILYNKNCNIFIITLSTME